MSDGSLSQEEIDALLQGAGGVEFDEPVPVAPADLKDAQFAEFSSIVKDTVDLMGSNLAMLLSKSVNISPPQIDQVNGELLAASLNDEVLTVVLDFNSGDEHGFIMGSDLAVNFAAAIQGMEGVELDEASINALQEAFQSMFSPLITALSDKSGKSLITNLPSGGKYLKDDLNLNGKFIRLTYSVSIDGGGGGTIIEYFSAGGVAAIIPGRAQVAESVMSMGAMGPGSGAAPPQEQMGSTMGGGMPAQQQMSNQMGGGTPTIQGVQFPNIGNAGMSPGEHGNIGLLMDVSMSMTVELGRTKRLIKDILGMGEGTIIELDKLAGEPVDILVNHKLIAKGEVVVIDENFGVRVTEIVSPMERMNTIS